MSRHVLVTGGAGFIGRHVTARLVARGDRVTVLDDLSMGDRSAVPGAELIEGDVGDTALLSSLLGDVDAVIHLAARVSIRASVDGLQDDFDNNLAATLRLLQALEGTAVGRFVFASSMAVYDDAREGVRIDESHPTLPRSPYGASKLAAEHYARLVCQRLGISQLTLRLFNTWGPGQTATPYVGLITMTIERLLAGEAPTIFGDGEQRRDFIHVDDVARAFLAALDTEVTTGVFNIGTGLGRSVNEVVAALTERIAPTLAPVFLDARPEELRHSVADTSRAQEVLGWCADEPDMPLGERLAPLLVDRLR